MVLGHIPTQKLILQKQIIPILFPLEKATSKNSIGNLASKILENALQEPSEIANFIIEVKNRSNSEMKIKAQSEKEKILQSLLLYQNQYNIDNIEEEIGWDCCICKEGLTYRPDEPLGFYVFISNQHHTSTHFIPIHFSCHIKASKTHNMSEWEAATLRNCERPCNAIYPFPTKNNYNQTLVATYSKFKIDNILSILIQNISHYIIQLSKGIVPDFRVGGGSIGDEAAMIPFLLFSLYSLILNPHNATSKDFLQTLLHEYQQSQFLSLNGSVLSFICMSLDEWNAKKSSYLQYLIEKNGDSLQIYFEFYITDRIHKMLKKPKGQVDSTDSIVTPDFLNFVQTIINDSYLIHDEWNSFGTHLDNEILSVKESSEILQKCELN